MISLSIKLPTYLVAAILLCIGSVSVHAQSTTWNGSVSSEWNNSSNWSNGVPGSGSRAVITNFTNKPILSTSATVNTIQLGSYYPGAGITSLTVVSGGNLTVTNEIEFNGNGGSLHIDGGNLNHTGTNLDWGSNVNRYIEMTSGSFTTNANFVINGGNNSNQPGFTVGSGTAVFNGDLTVPSSGKRFDIGDGEVLIEGNFLVGSGSEFNVLGGELTANGSITVNGTFNGDDGITSFNDEITIGSGGVLNLDNGIINFNANTSIGNNGTVNFGSGSVNFGDDVVVESSGFVNVQDAAVSIEGDAEFSNNGNLTVGDGSINVGGNASITSGGSISLGSGDLNLSGDLSVTGGSNFQADSSTVTFSGDSTQTVTTDGTDITFNDVVVDSGATFQTDGGTENVVIIEGNLTVNGGGNVVVEEDDKLDIQGEVEGDGADEIDSPSPFAVSAVATDLNTVLITFSKEMVESLAENSSNYSIVSVPDLTSVTVNSATLNSGDNGRQVTLSISTIQEDVEYRITMNNLESTDGGLLSDNHIKRFSRQGPITFYSRQNGNWDENTTWSTVSHTGNVANKNPTNTSNATVVIGDGHTVSVVNGNTITTLDTVSVNTSSKLHVASGGVLNLGDKTIVGAGTFEVSDAKIIIGSADGISATGATGNIQTSGRIFSSNGKYVFNAGSQQITGSGLPETMEELDIDNSSNVRATNDVKVTGTLHLTNGSLIISSGKNLIANTKNIENGNLILERNIVGNTGWRMLSSPLSTTYGDLLDSTITQGFSGAFYSTGSMPGDTLQPNVLYYDETYETNLDGDKATDNQRWRAPASASTSIPEAQGLYTYIFGDIDADPLYNDQFPLPLTLAVQGQENEGDGNSVDFGITYTTTADSGWNMVGNPYAATIDWDDASSWAKTNVDNTIYVWDNTVSSFKTWNGTTGDLDSQGLIAPFQAFWVKANDVNPSLEVSNDAKTFGGSYVGKIKNRGHDVPTISLTISNQKQEASTHFMFTSHALNGKDNSDAYRLVPPPGIGTFLDINSVAEDGSRLAINNLPRHFGQAIEIPIYVNAYKHGFSADEALTLSIKEFKNIPQGWQLTIQDNLVKSKLSIEEGVAYAFSYQGSPNQLAPNFSTSGKPKITSAKSRDKPRFTLIIHPGEDGADLPSDFKLEQNYPNPFNPNTNIQFDLPVQSYTELAIFNILGQQITTLVRDELPAGTHTFNWNAGSYSSGVYLYRLVTGESVLTKKMILVK